MNNRKNQFTEFGKSVCISLIQKGKTQTWLIDEIKKNNPERFIDSSLLNRILTGRAESQPLVNEIKAILKIT